MKVLLIVHATAWSDKACKAKEPIQRLVSDGSFDRIIEVAQSSPDIYAGRYLNHKGVVLQHDEITPVPLFREVLFGERPLFPAADAVTLVGGVSNTTGGGCLNVAFAYLVGYQKRVGRPCTITVPVWATYQAGEEPVADYPHQLEQVMKVLAWNMLRAGVSFKLTMDGGKAVTCGNRPLIQVRIATARDWGT